MKWWGNYTGTVDPSAAHGSALNFDLQNLTESWKTYSGTNVESMKGLKKQLVNIRAHQERLKETMKKAETVRCRFRGSYHPRYQQTI